MESGRILEAVLVILILAWVVSIIINSKKKE